MPARPTLTRHLPEPTTTRRSSGRATPTLRPWRRHVERSRLAEPRRLAREAGTTRREASVDRRSSKHRQPRRRSHRRSREELRATRADCRLPEVHRARSRARCRCRHTVRSQHTTRGAVREPAGRSRPGARTPATSLRRPLAARPSRRPSTAHRRPSRLAGPERRSRVQTARGGRGVPPALHMHCRRFLCRSLPCPPETLSNKEARPRAHGPAGMKRVGQVTTDAVVDRAAARTGHANTMRR